MPAALGGVRWAPLERADWPAAQALLTESEGHDRTGPRILHGWRHQLAPISDDRADTLAARTDDGNEWCAAVWLVNGSHFRGPAQNNRHRT